MSIGRAERQAGGKFNMSKISKVTLTFSRILEFLHWLGAAAMAAVVVISIVAKDWLAGVLQPVALNSGAELSTYGFEVAVTDAGGMVRNSAVLMFAIGAMILLILMAMIFRNMVQIVRHSEESSPFCPDNIRLLREIGIFSIANPIVGLFMSVLIRIVLGSEVETTGSICGLVVGAIALCLTQYFAQAAKLQREVDGLL